MSGIRPSDLQLRRAARVELDYRELRASDPDLFRKCVQYAEGVVLNNHRALDGATTAERSALAADIEIAMITLVMEMRRGAGP